MRVLDFVGVVEALGEVGRGVEEVIRRGERRVAERLRVRLGVGVRETGGREKRRKMGKEVGEIGDSDEDDEYEIESGSEVNAEEEEEEDGTTEILVLDDFTTLAGGLFGEVERNSGTFHPSACTFTEIYNRVFFASYLPTYPLSSIQPPIH